MGFTVLERLLTIVTIITGLVLIIGGFIQRKKQAKGKIPDSLNIPGITYFVDYLILVMTIIFYIFGVIYAADYIF